MAEIRVPTLGESVTEATIGKWFKKAGDVVAVDEPLVELETDKVTIEVPAPAAGVLTDVAVKDGDTVAVGALLGAIKEGAGAASAAKPDQKTEKAKASDAGAEQPKPKEEAREARRRQTRGRYAAGAVGAQDRRRNRRRCLRRSGHGQGRPRDQGRHACRHRARRGAADAGRGAGGLGADSRSLADR